MGIRIFDRRYEMMPRSELTQLQFERLQALLVRLRRNVRRYREVLGETRVNSLGDLAALPLTTPEEVAAGFPYGMFAMPLREVIRLHSTLGPEGKPLVIGHTRNDLTQWSRLVARQLVACGMTANDVVQIGLGGDPAQGAMGYLLGAEVIEASVIAEDPAHLDYQLAMLQNYRPTVLITTPTHALDLARRIEQQHLDPQSLHLRTVLLSRPVNQEAREFLRAGLFATVQHNFGLSEILDPGFCVECEAGHFHVNEDHFLVETVQGELVVTTLTREAMPLLRFQTRRAGELSHDKCPCGRTTVVVRPGQRLDRRLRVSETPLYESQIAELLAKTRLAGHAFKAEVMENHIVVSVKMTESLFADTIWPLEKLRREIETEFLSRLSLAAEVRFT